MPSLSIAASIPAHLTWDYGVENPRVSALYERGKQMQWNATTDIDWSIDVDFGSPLPDDSGYALAAFEASPLSSRGRAEWDRFRWESQSWMVSQFLHAEQCALVATARLVEIMPTVESKYYAASQVGDEARHVEAFARYVDLHVPEPYAVDSSIVALVADMLGDSRWDITALGMQIMLEGLALAAFRLANATFYDDLIKQITHLVGRDEAGHASFGVLILEGLYDDMTESERREREDFVLEAADLMYRRFLMGELWDRLEVDRRVGTTYAAENDLMIKYRQTIFTKAVQALARVGLMTDRVRLGFDKLNLLGIDRASR